MRGGGDSVVFGFVLHTGLEDPTTAVSERSLQKQTQDRKKPSVTNITPLPTYDQLQDQVFNYNCLYKYLQSILQRK